MRRAHLGHQHRELADGSHVTRHHFLDGLILFGHERVARRGDEPGCLCGGELRQGSLGFGVAERVHQAGPQFEPVVGEVSILVRIEAHQSLGHRGLLQMTLAHHGDVEGRSPLGSVEQVVHEVVGSQHVVLDDEGDRLLLLGLGVVVPEQHHEAVCCSGVHSVG